MIVYVNVGWMKEYQGLRNDRAVGNHRHLKTDKVAHESWNFKPLRGRVYGYVPRSAEIKIRRLGASSSDDRLEGVTVVWVARDPRTKRTLIVGWYENATIFRDAEHKVRSRAPGVDVGYQIECAEGQETLLPIDARSFVIPTAKTPGNLGQSPVWYGKSASFNTEVQRYIMQRDERRTKGGGRPRQKDKFLRLQVERNAVEHAIAFYESPAGGSRVVTSVEKDAIGWDLEAVDSTGDLLRIEVKGLSGKNLKVELTPNEYFQMKRPEIRASYVIYVVLDALQPQRFANIFRYDNLGSKRGNLVWANDRGDVLKIREVIGARLSLSGNPR